MNTAGMAWLFYTTFLMRFYDVAMSLEAKITVDIERCDFLLWFFQ